MKAPKVPTLRRKADRLMQEHYRKVYNVCEVCGNPMICMHHFFTKGSSAYLRYDDRNLIPICNSCHFKHHNTSNPTIHMTVIEKRGMDWYKELRRDSSKIQKVGVGYYKSIIERYEK